MNENGKNGAKRLVLKAKCFDVVTEKKIVVLNERDAVNNEIYAGHRIILSFGGKQGVAIADLSNRLVVGGEVGLFSEVAAELGASDGNEIEIKQTERPASIEFIKKKMDGKTLSESEIGVVISELMQNKLSEVELSSFLTSIYIRGVTDDEVVSLTNAIVASGDTLKLGKHPILDKHCAGGVAGNRTTMVLVPIIAAAGLYIPKTSSRSITSAAGTADTMEVLAPVNLSLQEIREIVLKTKGCMAWGGAVNLAAADDKLIRIRHPLSLDPKGLLLASILAKKKSVGADYCVIDVPIGRGAKITDPKEANVLAKDFIAIGKKLGIGIEVLITDGSDPIGNGIGPALECRDVVEVLAGKGPGDLMEKSCTLAGTLLELAGKVQTGAGYDAAKDLLKSGKAEKKFREIVGAQGGDENFRIDDLPIGGYSHKLMSGGTGRISHVDSRLLARIARAAGAPSDKGAGVFLHCEAGDKIMKGDTMFEVIAESESKLDFAIRVAESVEAIELEKVVLKSFREA